MTLLDGSAGAAATTMAETGDWRKRWHGAAAAPDGAAVASLTADLENLGLPEEEIEIEQEMLDGLAELVALRDAVAREGLPVVETGHRVVGADRCHFSAPRRCPTNRRSRAAACC